MSTAHYILHYAPDNASLVIRLALEELQLDYTTQLVDRRNSAHRSAAYRALNPNQLIPVLETPQGPLFETAAILLWLSDTHGRLGPKADDPQRAELLKWLFFLSNTLHPALRMLFYPGAYVGQDADHMAQLSKMSRSNILRLLGILEQRWADDRPGILLDLYLGPMMRWLALYPMQSDRTWFDLRAFGAIDAALRELEKRPSVKTAQQAEGLGPNPFTSPRLPIPPEGSAT